MERRVAVTGLGVISPVGNDVQTYWDSLVAGKCGIDTIKSFPVDELPSKVYSAVRYYNLFNAYYVILMATIIDDFEQRVYALESVEGFTGEDFDAIMTEVIADYGKSADWFEANLANRSDKDGKVSAKARGECTIYAVANNGVRASVIVRVE